MTSLRPYLSHAWKPLALALASAALNQIFSLLNPQIFGRIIDNYASQIDTLTRTDFLRGVGLLLALYVGVALISRIAKAFQDYFVNTIAEKVGMKFYTENVERVLTLPFNVFESHQSGSILQKMQQARDAIKKLIKDAVNIGFFSLIGMSFVLVYSLTIHWSIALLFFLAIPIVGGIISVLGKKVKESQSSIVTRSADLAASTTETLQNIELVKALGLEDQEITRLNNVNDEILDLELKKVVILRKLGFVQGTLINIMSSLIVLVGMLLIFNTEISLGQFLTLWFYGFFVFGPLASISQLVASYQEARASTQKVAEIINDAQINSQQEQLTPSSKERINVLENIRFDHVSFSYNAESEESLHNIDLTITSGSTVALVGPSGSGKSTFVKLLLGLYETLSGDILYNNKTLSSFESGSLRSKIGYVPQDTQIFAGTIRDNLTFVMPDATDASCMEALEKAQALSILEKKHDGLDTIIGENGIKLSGGERQRIAIARALLRKPDLLIFDEATSSLDTATESAITQTIQNIRIREPELIMIIIAHRLSTIQNADTIYVLQKGSLEESGTHDELVTQNSIYAHLWGQQR